MQSCAVLFHQFYEDTLLPDWQELSKTLTVKIYINKVTPFLDNQRVDDDKIVLTTPNCGKDIGGKLALIDCFLKLNDQSEWIIFIHDKKSPQLVTGDAWRKKLWVIVSQEFYHKTKNLLGIHSNVGMIGPASCKKVWNERQEASSQVALLRHLADQYNLPATSFPYVAGTMFWIKAEIVRSFFQKFSPLQIRCTLEKGNVMDTHQATITHAWERLFAAMVISSGKSIKFVEC